MSSLKERIEQVRRIRELSRQIEALQGQEMPLEKERADLHKKLAKHYGYDFDKEMNCKIVDAVLFELGQETFNSQIREGVEPCK